MKKNLLILTLALLVALPVLGLAADLTPVTTPETQTAAPILYGPRWRQNAAPATTAPQTGYVDADNNGICDNCGNALGTNPDAPNFIDENKDGICDHFGTDEQGQRLGRMQGMRGRIQQMMGRGQGMMGRGIQGNVQGQNYADANNDGVCDNFGTDTQRNFGPGRNRR
jgi:hypothetical protein